MHILVGQRRGLEAAEEAVDLGQTPGEIVFLTAADTEIAGLAAARRALGDEFSSVRLANWTALAHPYSVDLYAESVLAQARLVIVRLLGGPSYWRYGIEEAARIARGGGPRLAVLPGDAAWDADLPGLGTVATADCRRLWSYLTEGGTENYRNALRYAAHLTGVGACPPEPQALPAHGRYVFADRAFGGSKADLPAAAIVFYRALMQSGLTEPVDALCSALAERGLAPLPLYVSSLRTPADAAFVREAFDAHDPTIVLNATAFALSKAGGGFAETPLDGGRRPVIQIVFAGSSEADWAASSRGLSAKDLTMNVVLPEIDGRIFSRAVSFKEPGALDALTECRPVRYRPKSDRVAFVAELAARWAALSRLPNADKRVAVVLANYPNRDGRLANGVGLDAPASTVRVLAELARAGYRVEGAPKNSALLMKLLLAGPTNDRRKAVQRSDVTLSLGHYRRYFACFPKAVQAAVEERWGAAGDDPFVQGGRFVLPLHRFGNVVVGIQPARGYNIDPKASYHNPDLVPPHGYLAFYGWLRDRFGVHAVVQMGKHGNLEWLPGKALALSAECFPEAAFGPVPVVYPFIVNDPGEGAQAKRRSAAVVVDHLTPPLARAESHGAAAALEHLIDEYAAAEAADPRRAPLIAERIFDLAAAHGFDKDIGLDLADRDVALRKLDEHICDLKELQIRDGLHVFGGGPAERQRAETLVALARLPRGDGAGGSASLMRALAADLGLGEYDPLTAPHAERWAGPRPDSLHAISDAPWRTNGDTLERLEKVALALVEQIPPRQVSTDKNPSPQGGGEAHAARSDPLPVGERVARRVCGAPGEGGGAAFSPSPGPSTDLSPEGRGGCPGKAARAVLTRLSEEIAPALDASGTTEIRALLDALAGRFVRPGPAGAPTRGRPECLPTGRNFYSVDVRSVPTEAAWELGRRSADMLAERHFQETGAWPQSVALSAWGTSNMRTGGDDIAQALALIGARPTWEAGRVTGVEVMRIGELGRPRIDVTLRISGFFRDAFPTQITLFHEAVKAVSSLDEADDANPVAACVADDRATLVQAGLDEETAFATATVRVFGSKPGTYGAGLQALIDEGIWSDRADLADAFVEWSGYAYGSGLEGGTAHPDFRKRLSTVDAVVHNQDNREHDLLDSDDYYQFEGGLAAAVETMRGCAPRAYHNDHSRPFMPTVRTLEEEIARVVRGRAANPKWIAGVMRHGYKGAFEIAATVDYLFAFAATTNAVRHHHFEQLFDAYIGDETVRDFMADANAPALKEMAQKFREAIDRGLWAPRSNSAYDALARLAEGESAWASRT